MMDIKKWVPWNWFKREEERVGDTVPVRRAEDQRRGYAGLSPASHLHREIDRIFDGFFDGWPTLGARSFMPAMGDLLLKPTLDLSATDKAYTISVEIPGVDENDVKLELVNDTLTIRGEKRQEREEKDKNYYRMERSYGAFQRVLSLPEDADQDDIKAKFRRGVLTVTMPRRAVSQSGIKRIEVKST